MSDCGSRGGDDKYGCILVRGTVYLLVPPFFYAVPKLLKVSMGILG